MTQRMLAAGAAMMAVAAAAGPSQAGWREDMGTFRIGMVAEPGAGQSVQGLARIKEAYSAVLSVPVEVFVARDLPALIDAQAGGRVDYAIYSSTAYAVAWRLCECVEPLAAPVGEDGSTGIAAVLLARRGAAGSIDTMTGVKIALPTAAQPGGPMLARSSLAEAGLDLVRSGATLVETASAGDAERRLEEGEVDAMVGWQSMPVAATGTLANIALAGADAAANVVLWTSEPLRFGPHAVRKDLDPEAKQLLVSFLGGLRSVAPDVYELVETSRGGGFAAVSHADYGTALAMVDRAAGGR